MILHGLKVIAEELNNHLNTLPFSLEDTVVLGNIGGIDSSGGGALKGGIVMTLVNIREEKTLKNGVHSRTNDRTLRTEYFNPPVFVNLYVLFSVTSNAYETSLTHLSRIVRFFQSKNVFTHENSVDVGGNNYDRMTEFKLIMDLYSPSFEEMNYLWGTLGGKQYPSVLYCVRLVELKHETILEGGGVVMEIEQNTGVIPPFS